MISKLSVILTEKLYNQKIIEDEDKELYEYALYMIISYVSFLVLSLIVGLTTGIVIESLIFFISFCIVRNFAGGVHANTEIKCIIFSTFAIVSSILIIKVLTYFCLIIVSSVIIVLSIACLMIMSPVDTSNKRLNSNEKSKYHKNTIILTSIIAIVFVFTVILKNYSIAIALSVGMMLSAILVVAGKIEQSIANCKNKSA